MLDLPLLTIIWYVVEWLLRIAALFVVPRNRKPTAGMAWLLFIFLIPVVGWLFFFVLGSPKLPKSRREAQRTLDRYLAASLKEELYTHASMRPLLNAQVGDKYQSLARLGAGLTHMPVFAGNAIEPLVDYNAVFEKIRQDIRSATEFVYIEYYILALDSSTMPLFEELIEAATRGVVVRVMYDAYGSHKYPRFVEMKQLLHDNGVHVQALLPLRLPTKGYVRPDLRNHRKLVVIDGRIGYTGSQNIVARNYHRRDKIVYDELVVRVVGPIVVQLEAVFVTDWFSETGHLLEDAHPTRAQLLSIAAGESLAQLVPSGPGYDYENNRKVFTALMYEAEYSITIVNPYFVPDESLITALVSAANRGVQVTMINSEAVDQWMVAHAQRSYYEEMLKAGVEIFLYKAPTLLHSKYILVDDDIALVGSSNMDIRSFELNHELTLISYDTTFAHQMAKITAAYKAKSVRITPRKWLTRRRYKQLLDNLARLTSALQ